MQYLFEVVSDLIPLLEGVSKEATIGVLSVVTLTVFFGKYIAKLLINMMRILALSSLILVALSYGATYQQDTEKRINIEESEHQIQTKAEEGIIVLAQNQISRSLFELGESIKPVDK